MLDSFMSDRDYSTMLAQHAKELLLLLFSKETSFDVLANMAFTTFEPALPNELLPNDDAVLFALGGYTLQSARIEQGCLKFHAGFGRDNFASLVSIPLHAIIRLSMGKNVLFINFSICEHETQIQKSRNIFKSNPENKNIFGE